MEKRRETIKTIFRAWRSFEHIVKTRSFLFTVCVLAFICTLPTIIEGAEVPSFLCIITDLGLFILACNALDDGENPFQDDDDITGQR